MILSWLEEGKLCRREVGRIEFDKECDVLTVGLGAAGSFAAIAAAREGVRVIAVEKEMGIGGMPVNGRVNGYYYGSPGGTFEEIDAEMRALRYRYANGYAADARQTRLWRLLTRYGVSVFAGTVVTGVYFDGNRVVGARFHDGEHEWNFGSHILIDATSDGHVLRMCPVKTHVGRDIDGKTVPFTFRAEYEKAGGGFDIDNHDSGYCNQYRAADYSRRILSSHADKLSCLGEGNRMIAAAPVTGVREGLRFEGEETLTIEDVLLANSPSDILFWAYSDIDKHGHDLALDTDIYQNWWCIANLSTVTVRIPVPAGAILPKGLCGIVTAGRCLSTDVYALTAVRMNRDMFRMGECVGIRAALAVKSGLDFAEAGGELYEKTANRYGCFAGYADRKFGFDKNRPDCYVPVDFAMSDEEILSRLETETPSTAIWSAYRYGNDTLAGKLEDGMKNGKTARFRGSCAIALGIMGRHEALEGLRELVCERSCYYYKDNRRSNQFPSAIALCLLARMGEEADLPLLCEILFDPAEIEKPMYHTLEPNCLFCSSERCNYVFLQHYMHAAVALVKIGKRCGKNFLEQLRERFSGESRRELLLAATDDKPGNAFYEEFSDFLDIVLRLAETEPHQV